MKIAVNTRLLLKGKLEGIGLFSNETLRRITQWHPEHQFYFIFDREYDESFIFSDNITPVIAHPQARHPYLWYLFFEYGIPLKLKTIKPDLFLSTDGWIPTKLDIPTVNVIHDLNFVHHPEFIKPVVRRYYDRYFPKFARNATRLATVSQFSQQDIHQSYQVPLDHIDVVYNGANPAYVPLSTEQQQAVKQQHTGGCDFFLFVGLIHKRKNLANIFKAFDRFKSSTPNSMKLVVVGDKKWWAGEIEDTFLHMNHRDDVVMLGRQQIDALSRLTASATALVYASLFEGFGQPIVDAYNAHTPVITSNITSMPEIAGNAAMLVNPYSVEQIAEAMYCLYSDDQLRCELINKGVARKDIFTWDRTAELLWQTIEKVLLR
jgi:glycosyltransferase involved in cell wall biosynthesis